MNIFNSEKRYGRMILLLAFAGGFWSCNPNKQKQHDDSYLVRYDSGDESGYKNLQGEVVIPAGKYTFCFTDTFRTYAIVLQPESGFIAIDRQGEKLYEVFPYDNGPDFESEGLFRIVRDKKIGYADAADGSIVIDPKYDCAFPFENGVAQVSTDCRTQQDGEYTMWLSDAWEYINKRGKKVQKPETDGE